MIRYTCMHIYSTHSHVCIYTHHVRTERWTADEKMSLGAAVKSFGWSNRSKLSSAVVGRTQVQVHSFVGRVLESAVRIYAFVCAVRRITSSGSCIYMFICKDVTVCICMCTCIHIQKCQGDVCPCASKKVHVIIRTFLSKKRFKKE
jgi:hypothetical protein